MHSHIIDARNRLPEQLLPIVQAGAMSQRKELSENVPNDGLQHGWAVAIAFHLDI